MANEISEMTREEIMEAWNKFQDVSNDLMNLLKRAGGHESFDIQRARAYWMGELDRMQDSRGIGGTCTIPETLRVLGIIDSDGEMIQSEEDEEDGSLDYESKEDCEASELHLVSCDSDGYCNNCGEQ